VICATAFGVKAFAESKDLTAEMKVWKILKKDGVESRVAADRVKAGDVLEYQVIYQNHSTKTLRNIQAQLPVPAAMEYVSGSAHPAGVQASIDGNKFASVPLRRRVVVDGKSKVEIVPSSEYRYLRWNIASLGVHKSSTVSARMRLKK